MNEDKFIESDVSKISFININNIHDLIFSAITNMNREKESPWKYFKRDNDSGICKIENCKRRIKTGGGKY